MKRTKRIITLVMVMMFAFTGLLGCGSKGKNVVCVSSDEVKQGEEVTVYLRSNGEIPVAAFGFNVYYNTEELSYVEAGKADDFEKAWAGMDVFNDTESDGNEKAVIFAGVNTNESEGKYKGDLYYITFKAIGEAGTKAELSLDVSALENLAGESFLDECSVENGIITIK